MKQWCVLYVSIFLFIVIVNIIIIIIVVACVYGISKPTELLNERRGMTYMSI